MILYRDKVSASRWALLGRLLKVHVSSQRFLNTQEAVHQSHRNTKAKLLGMPGDMFDLHNFRFQAESKLGETVVAHITTTNSELKL